MANKTISDAYGMAQDLLKFEGSTVGIPALEEARTIQFASDLNEQYFRAFWDRGLNAPEYMRKEKGYTAVAETALAANVLAAATTFTIDSSSALDTSGAGVIWKAYQFDTFTFTGNSSGTVTGASGIDFAHADGEGVGKLYALPADYGNPRKGLDAYGAPHDGVRVDGAGYRKGDEPGARAFAIWQDSSQNLYLWLPRYVTGDVLVTYDKKPTTLSSVNSTTGTLDITGTDYWYVVYGLLSFFRQTQDEDYVPQKEEIKMQQILVKALARRSIGKQLSVGGAYFNRRGLGGKQITFPYTIGA